MKKVWIRFALSGLLTAGIVCGLPERLAAQQTTACKVQGTMPNGTLGSGQLGEGSFPATAANDPPTFSMGVFEVVPLPQWAYLFNAGTVVGGTTYPDAYPGWNGTALVSPIVYDPSTKIGSSAPVNHGALPSSITIGAVPTADTVTGYPPNMPLVPFFIAESKGVNPGTREVLTEIQSFTLATGGTNYCGCGSTLVPCFPGTTPIPLLMVGQYNPDVASLGLPPLAPSYGLVQSQANGESGYFYNSSAGINYDFPANSFFDVNALVDFPQTPSSLYAASVLFPANGLMLETDPTAPVIVQCVPPNDVNFNDLTYNPALCSLPPNVIYIHGQAMSPVLRFANNNGTIWSAGEPFGTLVLAGHGVLQPCTDGPTSEQILINAVIGTNGSIKSPSPTGYLLPKAQFPPGSGVAYASIQGLDFSGGMLDTLNFASSNLFLAELVISNWLSLSNLPAPGQTLAYTNSGTLASCMVAVAPGTTYSPATGTGTAVFLVSGATTSGNSTTYTLQIPEFTFTFSSSLGNIYMRQSTNSNSVGTHIVQTTSEGKVVASSYTLFPTVSTDDANFYEPNRGMFMELASAPCGLPGTQLNIMRQSTGKVTLWWHDPGYILEGTSSLTPPVTWTVISTTSPVTLSESSQQQFYRIVCPGP